MKKYIVMFMLLLTWMIYFKNGETMRAKELCSGQWATSNILAFIDTNERKIYVLWSDIEKVVEEK